MTHDIETLTQWLRVFLWITAVFVTAYPFLYSFAPWRSTKLGQIMMLKAVSYALAIDSTLVFQYWYPTNILVIFWWNVILFALLSVSSGAVTVLLWQANFAPKFRRKRKKRVE